MMKSCLIHVSLKYTCVAVLSIALSVAGLAQGMEESLKNDFTALRGYDLGASEIPVRTISEAVRATASDPDGATAAELETELIAVFTADSTGEAKRFCCRMLGEIGGPASVSALAGQLNTPEMFNSVVTALEQIALPESARALMDALNGAEGERWFALMAALGRQGLPESASAIQPFLAATDKDQVYGASQALAALQTRDACEALSAAFRAADAAGQILLADACLQCAASCLHSEQQETVLENLNALASPSFPSHIRLAATRLLVQAQPEKAQTLLTTLLRDPDPILSDGALMLARSESAPQVTEALAALLGEVQDERKAPLLEVLGARGDSACLAAVQPYADHESPAVRQAALRAMGKLGDAKLTTFLLGRIVTGSGEERRIAGEALAQMPDPAVNASLIENAIAGGDEALRTAAITQVVARRAGEAAPSLLALAGNAPPAVRSEATAALGTLAPEAMLNDLLQFVLAPEIEGIEAVLPQTLAAVAQRRAPGPESTDAAGPVIALSQQLRTTPSDSLQRTTARRLLLETLALIGTDGAFEESRALLADSDTEVRKAAIDAVKRFQRPDALAELKALTENETDAPLRARAYSAYLASLCNAKSLPRVVVDEHLTYAFAQAQDTASQREFLAAAAQLPSLACLRLIEQLMEQEALAAEAVLAALTVSKALTGAWPEAAQARLKAIAEQAPTPEIVHDAKEALNFMRKHKDYMMTWEMAGPYFEEQTQASVLFERSFPPETDSETANWRVLPLLVDADPAFALELDRVVGGEERVVYLRTFVTAKEQADAILELGTNDGCRVWWNGNLIHALNVGRPLVPGEDKLPVHLNQGVNTLMLAVFQQGGAWRATARLTDPQGQRLQNCTLSSIMPEK